jgi:carbonic anhydrase
VVVLHHTDCGLQTVTTAERRARPRPALGADAAGIDFLPFSDVEASVRQDVAALRESPLVPHDVAVSGFVYAVRTAVRTGRPHDVP